MHTLNKVFNRVNEKYHSKKLLNFVQILLHDAVIMMHQPDKRSHTNFVGGNNDYGAKFGCIFNFKDTCKTLPSCEECKDKLAKIFDNDACSYYHNWNFLNGKCSSKCMDSNR